MIKTTITTDKKKKLTNYKKIAEGNFVEKTIAKGIVLDKYKPLASGFCVDKLCNKDESNIILFEKLQNVA